MDKSEAIAKLDALFYDPYGESHQVADIVLLELLTDLGEGDVVAAYKSADKRIGFNYD